MNFDEMIRAQVAANPNFPKPWFWIKAQIWAESGFDVNAVSPCGAQGLMQLMPNTAKELGVKNSFNPFENIGGGVRFMAHLYKRYKEIPDPFERYIFALAAYNCGPGHVNMALGFARKAEGKPVSFKAWQEAGSPSGRWQTWLFASGFLKDTGCRYQETIQYVAKILRKVEEYQV